MKRGDVVKVDLPEPRGKAGTEQFGYRPAVILQVDPATANLSTVILVPFTSKQHNLRFVGSVPVNAAPANGLDEDSVALVHQLRAIDKKRIARVTGQLSGTDLANVESRIRDKLAL